MEGDRNQLVCGFQLTREAAFIEPNLESYPSDGSVPEERLKAVLTPEDVLIFYGRSSKSYANGRLEDDVAMVASNGDIAPAGNMVIEGVTSKDGKTYIVDAYNVADFGEDAATSCRQWPSMLRRLGHDLDLNVVTASQDRRSQGR